MKDFYSIEENFKSMYDDIYILLSNKIVDSNIAENWLVNWYVCDKYNTTRAIEKCAADLVIPKLKHSEIPSDVFKSVINKKLNGCFESYNDIEMTLEDKKYMIEHIQKMTINESTLSYLIQDFEHEDIVEYIKEGYYDNSFNMNKISSINEDTKEILNIISHIKHSILENKDNKSKLDYIKECNISVLYKYKYIAIESYLDNISETYTILESLLENQSDGVIDYTLGELVHCNRLIEHFFPDKNSDEYIYHQSVKKFNSMIESIFFEDTEIELDDVVELYQLTEALCDYETNMEASSRIITKGTEKVTRAIGKASAKSSGMNASDSKVGQIKRGAKIVDDKASDAINHKIDQILNFSRDAKREKIIEGKNTIRLSKVLKTAIGLVIGGNLVFKTGHPLLGAIATIIGVLGASALSKSTEVREKRRILLDLETELKITREKIDDAKSENEKEKKYQLMRIEAQLEKEIFRIKHGMKYY